MKKPIKRLEFNKGTSKFRLRFSRTGGASASIHPVKGLTLNTKHGVRLSKTFKGLTLGFHNRNSTVRGRWSSKNQLLNVNLSKSGLSLSIKSTFGSYNLTNPNRSSFKFAGIQIRGKNAKGLALIATVFYLPIIIIKAIPSLFAFVFLCVKLVFLLTQTLIQVSFNLSKLLINIFIFIVTNAYNLLLFLMLDVPEQLINIIFRTEVFDLQADLSDQLDFQEVQPIHIEEVKAQLALFGPPYKEISLFTKVYKFSLYLMGWMFSFSGGLLAVIATLGYFQFLDYENNQILSVGAYLYQLAFATLFIFIGYISKKGQRNIFEQKQLESILANVSSKANGANE